MTLALKSPSLIENLIPVDNAPLDAALLSSFGTYIRGMKALASTPITKQSEALSFLEPYESSLVIRQFLLGNLHKPPGEKHYRFKVPLKILGEALDNLGDFPYKDPEMVRCEKETLMVRGTQSKYVPDEAIPIIGRFFPRFRMVDIDCGHWVTSEKPEEFRQGMFCVAVAVISCDGGADLLDSCCRVFETKGMICVFILYTVRHRDV